jgi:putative SOS response-associated peptidase YedK
MCGRFTLTSGAAGIQLAFPGVVVPETLVARYNIAPSQAVAVLRNTGTSHVELVRWGLIPPWAKDPAIGSRLINARAETLAEKPAFRAAFRRRRCLIPADGFYEWRQDTLPGSQRKTPLYFRLKSGLPFAFAGLWEVWHGPDGQQWLSCTIVTTTPNSLLETVHTRMPVILQPSSYAQWLDPAEQNPASLSSLLQPYPASEMEGYAVSTLVNDPQNDVVECVVPA